MGAYDYPEQTVLPRIAKCVPGAGIESPMEALFFGALLASGIFLPRSALTAAGWTVLRFTGSEVHRDAMACALEVIGLLERGLIDAASGAG